MSRETYQQVLQLADQILLRGERPTQQRIRAELGRGSLTTINKALADWWSTLGRRLQQANDIPELPAELVAGMQQLWQQALRSAAREQQDLLVVADEQLKRTRRALKDAESQRDDERSRLTAQLQALLETSTQQQQIIDEQRREISALVQQLADAESRNSAQQREIKSLDAALARLGAKDR